MLGSEWFPPPFVQRDYGLLGVTDDAGVFDKDARTGRISIAYLWSFFWAVSLSCGYQDFLPQTAIQTAFSTVVVINGFLASAIILGSVTTARPETLPNPSTSPADSRSRTPHTPTHPPSPRRSLPSRGLTLGASLQALGEMNAVSARFKGKMNEIQQWLRAKDVRPY